MTRGQRPVPTALKILNGNPGHRPLNDTEPTLDVALPECPDFIESDPVALKEWHRATAILLKMRILTVAEQSVVAMYCVEYSLFVEVLAKLKKEGTIVKSPTGFYSTNPLFTQITAIKTQMLRLLAEIGFTPTARVRLSASPAEPAKSEWSEFADERSA